MSTCKHCHRPIVTDNGQWVDLNATGDDSVWRETCDSNDTFPADHEPLVFTTLQELSARVIALLPDALFDEDRNGEVVIYTNHRLLSDDRLAEMKEELA